MKKWQYVTMLGIVATCLVGCAREEGPAEKLGKKIDAFSDDTKEQTRALTEDAKEKARELKKEVEDEIQKRRDQEQLRRQQEVRSQPTTK